MKPPTAEEVAKGWAEYFAGDCACENARKCKSCDMADTMKEALLSFSLSQMGPMVEALEIARSWLKYDGHNYKSIDRAIAHYEHLKEQVKL